MGAIARFPWMTHKTREAMLGGKAIAHVRGNRVCEDYGLVGCCGCWAQRGRSPCLSRFVHRCNSPKRRLTHPKNKKLIDCGSKGISNMMLASCERHSNLGKRPCSFIATFKIVKEKLTP